MADLELWKSLLRAVETSDLPQLTSLLAQHPSPATINHADEVRDTLLHSTARKDNGAIAQALVDAGANVDAVNDGRAPIHNAAILGGLNVARVLIRAGANLNLDTSIYGVALTFALENHHIELARLLADAGACIDPEYEAKHANELRLWTAVLRGDLDELRRRIDAGDRVDRKPRKYRMNGWTALLLAVALGRADAARMLIQAGANVNAAGEHKYTPLHLAVAEDQFDLAKLLVEAKANVNAADDSGRVPLHIASEKGNLDMARLLIDAGANVDATDTNGRTSLHDASSKGDLEVAKFLVETGANFKLLDKDGKSALPNLLSTLEEKVTPTSISEIFTLLTDAGATVDGATAEISPRVPSDVIRAIVPEDTPFWLAANNDAPMLAVELAGGLDPNMKTENGMTLLRWACAGDAPECVQLLLDAGANKEAGEPKPIFYCMHESSQCLECMINFDVDVNQSSKFGCLNKYHIHLALAANSPACVTALVGAGAWVTREEMGNTPLLAAFGMRPVPVDALRALLAAAGERVLSEKIYGISPLYWAVENSNVDGVRVLVEGGADVNEMYEDYYGGIFGGVLKYARSCLSDPHNQAEAPRLTAIVDYLKSLPCFSEEQ